VPIVYFLCHELQGSPVKIGRTTNIEKRTRNLQTGNPLKLQLLGWIETADAVKLEWELKQEFRSNKELGEWFDIGPDDILPVLQRAGRDGFVGKNADAFQVVSYDRDGIPEFLGVWEWADLNLEECCPFCGCLCGMHFNDASEMYHCTQCNKLTNFPEPDPYD
jgi:hypothetical protein